MSAKTELRQARRQLETMLALRHTLEQQRLDMEVLAVMSGNPALAELTEAQALTLDRLKREWAAMWKSLNEAIADEH